MSTGRVCRTLPMLLLRCKRCWLVVVAPGMLARRAPCGLVRHQQGLRFVCLRGWLPQCASHRFLPPVNTQSLLLRVSIQRFRQMQLGLLAGHRELRASKFKDTPRKYFRCLRSIQVAHARIHDSVLLAASTLSQVLDSGRCVAYMRDPHWW